MKIEQADSLAPAVLIGASVPRIAARRLVAGRGRYVDDVRVPGALYAAFVRSPYASATIERLDLAAASRHAGVVACVDAGMLERVCKPWTTQLATLPQHRSAPQPPLAAEHVVYQGQPVALVVARSRAIAEDAAALVEVDWGEREAVASWRDALSAATPIHATLGSNLAFEHRIEHGDLAQAFAQAHRVVKLTMRFPRHTGVSLESRGLLAEFDPTTRRLTVHASTQVPHQFRTLLARHLSLRESDIRVLAPDVGGGFGVKLHGYDDELAIAASAVLLGRPIKWINDRMESFVSDVHAREHEAQGEIAVDAHGRILALRVDDVVAVGAYSIHPRSSVLEGMHAIMVAGAPYDVPAYAARLRVAYQNKPNTGSYRGVGQPVGCGITEQLIDAAARELAIDPAEMRRRNLRVGVPAGGKTASGLEMEALSQHACLEKLLAVMNYEALRVEQMQARKAGRYLGIGLSAFLEQTAPGPGFYGAANVPISAADGCVLRLEPDGSITAVSSTLDQGQGNETALAQLVANAMSAPLAAVRIVGGDTAATAVGGGTFASRGMSIGGEATMRAAHLLRERLIGAAAALLGEGAATVTLEHGAFHALGKSMSIAELAHVLHFQPYKLPADVNGEPMVVAHWVPQRPYMFANGVQASLVEVDPDTGFISLRKHWIVEDCGRVINPLLVDEQLRGGIIQGIGAALFEELRYDARGQLMNASMADYLVPMAFEMPDIVVDHVATPVEGTLFGGKGVGEAGTVGAAAAVVNAVNDALMPLRCVLTEQPLTPERVLQALGKVAR